ncbi:DEAD/DEAH box helicase family protein [Streptomyces lunaelactis]|uniref:DEAD/DEAH box helicase family protein n=1 Tax=Streptomyces lunaelactis TaxID=1535768 RepID=UPI0027B97855|nr:DEAD/DEAH box helicase family protein [Streptomyces lunaelactis]
MRDTKTLKPLREHQAEAVVAAVRELELPAGAPLPPVGQRTQVIMATGSGKTLVAVHTSEELTADRVLVLVPSLDLLEQTARAWRDGGRPGPFFGVSSLKSDEVGFPTPPTPTSCPRPGPHHRFRDLRLARPGVPGGRSHRGHAAVELDHRGRGAPYERPDR